MKILRFLARCLCCFGSSRRVENAPNDLDLNFDNVATVAQAEDQDPQELAIQAPKNQKKSSDRSSTSASSKKSSVQSSLKELFESSAQFPKQIEVRKEGLVGVSEGEKSVEESNKSEEEIDWPQIYQARNRPPTPNPRNPYNSLGDKAKGQVFGK
jgi:hypothetical protein